MPVFTGDIRLVLDQDDLVKTVGFGFTATSSSDYGIKRVGELPVSEVAARTLGFGGPGQHSCNGDSGGPQTVSMDGTEYVVAIVKSSNCSSSSTGTAIAPYWDEFVVPTVDRWVGACREDGVCVTEGCRSADPDCDVCAFNGDRGADCPAFDWDCPLRQPEGTACERSEDCESSFCVVDPSYPGQSHCALPCSERLAPSVCGPGFECVEGADSQAEPVCRKEFVPQPAGAPCGLDSPCATEVCLDESLTCAASCDVTDCADGFVCEAVDGRQVCVPSNDGGCACAIGGKQRAPTPILAAMVLLLFRALRRKRD